MAGTNNTNASSQPEEVRRRSERLQPTRYSFPKVAHPHGIQFIFMDYDYNRFVSSLTNGGKLTASNAGDPGAIKKLGFVELDKIPDVKKYTAVELPFPRTLNDETSINNQAFERSFLYERLTAAIAGSGGFSGAATQLGEMARDVLAAIRSTTSGEGTFSENLSAAFAGKKGFENIGAASQYLSRTFLPGDLQKQIGNASGTAVNPLQTLAFTGVDLKSYSFTWDLFPSNQEDSKRIKEIVQVLKHKALPQVESFTNNGKGVQGLNRAFLKYPSVVLVNLLGIDESHFVRFKPAMLTNVTVNYGGPAGVVGILKGGKPAAVTLTLSFTELNIHTSEDYPIDPDGDDAGGSVEKETPKVIGA